MSELSHCLSATGVRSMVAVGLALGISACEPGLTQTARARGATDLDCPTELVSAYRAQGGTFVARGCERWIEYVCLNAAGPVCTPQSEPHAHPTPGS
jgi:hypothetical protein